MVRGIESFPREKLTGSLTHERSGMSLQGRLHKESEVRIMMDWKDRRKKIGMTQFLLAQATGISRMRLSQAETEQLSLSDTEIVAVHRALSEYLATKTQEFRMLLSQEGQQVGTA
jgi:DNA-binding XRE family transcriptional regulator